MCVLALLSFVFLLPQAKQREQLMLEQERQNNLSNEVESIKATLGKVATELAQTLAQNENARGILDDKRKRLDAARRK